jgi:hypothetical protein
MLVDMNCHSLDGRLLCRSCACLPITSLERNVDKRYIILNVHLRPLNSAVIRNRYTLRGSLRLFVERTNKPARRIDYIYKSRKWLDDRKAKQFEVRQA